MLLELPILRQHRSKWIDDVLFINPAQISSVEKDIHDKRCCLMKMQNGDEFYVKLTVDRFRMRLNDYLHENVLSKLYKEFTGN